MAARLQRPWLDMDTELTVRIGATVGSEIRNTMEQRTAAYRPAADFCVNTDELSAEQACSRTIAWLNGTSSRA